MRMPRLGHHERMPAAPLPEDLGLRFRVADALAAGVPPARLRAGDLEAPFHGVRSIPAATAPGGISVDRNGEARGELEAEHLRRAWEYAMVAAEHSCFSHVTAAVAYGLPIPPHLLSGRGIDVAVSAPHRLPRGRGVRGHQVKARQVRIIVDEHTGLRLTDPASTWATLGSVLTDPYDLVAAGDAVVRQWRVDRPLATLDDLQAMICTGRRVGVPALRAALPRIRTRSASRPETHSRLTLVDAGLPEPILNFDVFSSGIKVGCVDLAYPQWRIAIEYEGEHHLLDPVQWARDIRRYERLAAAGWHVVRVTKAELFGQPRAFVNRVRSAIAARS